MKHHLLRFFGGFKGILFVLILIVGLLLHLYIQHLVNQLRDESRVLVTFYAQMFSRLANSENVDDVNFIYDPITKVNLPLIQTNADKQPLTWKNIDIPVGDKSEEALSKVQKMVNRLDKEIDPVEIKYEDQVLGYLFYGDSRLIERLQWVPYIEVGVIGLFLFLGLIGSAQIKKSEERYIWVGMAKETAHQLGTPISSLMGWIEIMRTGGRSPDEIAGEMNRDLARLMLVTQRFSEIGSKPDLKQINPEDVLREVCDYIRQRAPGKGKRVLIKEKYETVPNVEMNAGLFQWAIENIMKNSLDAMDKHEGRITVTLSPCSNGRKICIELSDNGKGIEEKNKKRIFKPGFSTKKRGWGLGLSLSRRIIEDYHNGRVFVKESRLGGGTVIQVEL